MKKTRTLTLTSVLLEWFCFLNYENKDLFQLKKLNSVNLFYFTFSNNANFAQKHVSFKILNLCDTSSWKSLQKCLLVMLKRKYNLVENN